MPQRAPWCCGSQGAHCGWASPSQYLLMLRAPPLLLPAHLFFIVSALFPLLLLPELLLSPLLLWVTSRHHVSSGY